MKRLNGMTMFLIALSMSLVISSPAHARSLVLQFFGPSEVTKDFDDALRKLDFVAENFTCYKMSLMDPETKRTVGKGVDCLNFDELTTPPALAVDAVSFFIFRHGMFVTKGRTSLQPFVLDFGDGGTPPRTHMTGSIPSKPTIIHGTKAFRKIKGTVRLSGAVALTGTENGNPFFDCLWVVNIRVPHRNSQ